MVMAQAIGDIFQTAYVVGDLELALERWLARTGAGPFFVYPHLQVEDLVYRGALCEADISIALGYSGGLCIALVQQHNDAPSIYRERFGADGEGFHHWGVFSRHFDADVGRYRDMGYDVALAGRVRIGGRFAYMDTVRELGGSVELIEFTPAVGTLFGAMEAAARVWDGDDPVRRADG